MSLFAQTSAKPNCGPPAPVGEGDTRVVLQVIDETRATIAHAHILLRDEGERVIVSSNTNQDGLLRISRLAAGSYVFSVSAKPWQDFQGSFHMCQDQVMEIEVVLKDRCLIDPNLNCDEVIPTPPFVDVSQPNSAVVMEPYPILQEPASRRPGFFNRLLSRFRHRHN
jgi:hypothetical protein